MGILFITKASANTRIGLGRKISYRNANDQSESLNRSVSSTSTTRWKNAGPVRRLQFAMAIKHVSQDAIREYASENNAVYPEVG